MRAGINFEEMTEFVEYQKNEPEPSPFGPVPNWVTVRSFWCSVEEIANTPRSLFKAERTQLTYVLETRLLENDLEFSNTRIVWTASDTGVTKLLRPITGKLNPGKGGRQWLKIGVEDITDLVDPTAPAE